MNQNKKSHRDKSDEWFLAGPMGFMILLVLVSIIFQDASAGGITGLLWWVFCWFYANEELDLINKE